MHLRYVARNSLLQTKYAIPTHALPFWQGPSAKPGLLAVRNPDRHLHRIHFALSSSIFSYHKRVILRRLAVSIITVLSATNLPRMHAAEARCRRRMQRRGGVCHFAAAGSHSGELQMCRHAHSQQTTLAQTAAKGPCCCLWLQSQRRQTPHLQHMQARRLVAWPVIGSANFDKQSHFLLVSDDSVDKLCARCRFANLSAEPAGNLRHSSHWRRTAPPEGIFHRDETVR